MNKGIIFDLDGTLWDTSHQVVEAWNKALDKCKDINNHITIKEMEGFMGKTVEEIVKIFFADYTQARGMEIITECLAEEVKYIKKHGATLYPAVETTLKHLSKNYKLYIVSNCQVDYLFTFIKYYKLDNYFVDYECAGRTGLSKGENIKLVIKRNQLDKSIYVGDTQLDYDAAEFAGIPFVFANYGFGDVNEDTYKIFTFDEILKIVKILRI